MSKHTPGPWRYEFAPGYCGEIWASNGDVVAAFIDEPGAEDARLIAAAPALLEALRHIEGVAMADEPRDLPGIAQTARAAIAKATGEQA